MSIKKSFNSTKGVYKVTFTLPAEAAKGNKKVVVLGDFNNWESAKGVDMKAGKNDFSASIELAPGTYQFRYLIDNSIWENDYQADNYVSSPFPGINNSVIFLPSVEKKEVAKKEAPVKKAAPAKKEAVVAKKVAPKVEKAVAKTSAAKTPAVKPAKVAKPVAAKAASSAVKAGTKAPASAKAKPAAVKAENAAKK